MSRSGGTPTGAMGVETGAAAKDGLRDYYRAKIEEYELAVRIRRRTCAAWRRSATSSTTRCVDRAVRFGTGLRSGRPARARRGERARRDTEHPRPRRIARGRSARHVVSRPVRTSHAVRVYPRRNVFADAPPPSRRSADGAVHRLQGPIYVGEVAKVMAKTKVLVKVRDVRGDHARARDLPPCDPSPAPSVVVLGVPTRCASSDPTRPTPPRSGAPRGRTWWISARTSTSPSSSPARGAEGDSYALPSSSTPRVLRCASPPRAAPPSLPRNSRRPHDI